MKTDAAGAYLTHLQEQGRSANTIAAYRRDLQRYAEFLRSRGLDDPREVTGEVLAVFPQWLRAEAGYAETSAARIVAAVRGLHRWLDADGGLGPATRLRVPDKRRPAPVLTVTDVMGLLEVEGRSDVAVRDRAILELLYATGARTSEVVALTPAAVDLERRRVRLPGPSAREAPLGPAAVAALQDWLQGARRRVAPTAAALLTNLAGDGLTRQGLWQIVTNRAHEFGLVASPGTLRASVRRHLLDAGMPPTAVRRLFVGGTVVDDDLLRAWDAAHPRGAGR